MWSNCAVIIIIIIIIIIVIVITILVVIFIGIVIVFFIVILIAITIVIVIIITIIIFMIIIQWLEYLIDYDMFYFSVSGCIWWNSHGWSICREIHWNNGAAGKGTRPQNK